MNDFVPKAFPLKFEKREKEKQWPWEQDWMIKRIISENNQKGARGLQRNS